MSQFRAEVPDGEQALASLEIGWQKIDETWVLVLRNDFKKTP